MSHKQFTLNIQEHCTENWDSMTKQEQGRFCGQCATKVVDFTSMSDNQIKTFFKNFSGQVCGRAFKTQLNRPFSIHSYKAPWYTKRFLHVALSGLLTLKLADSFAVQGQEIKTEQTPLQKEISQTEISHAEKENKKSVSGKVSDGEHPLHGVVVSVMETEQFVNTNEKGEFELTLPDSTSAEQVTLIFSLPGFLPEFVTVQINQLPKKGMEVRMNENSIKMGIIMYDEKH